MKEGKKPQFMYKPNLTSPRRRSVHLGEPEAPNFPISASPRQRLLCLGELEVMFLFISSVNSGNHKLD